MTFRDIVPPDPDPPPEEGGLEDRRKENAPGFPSREPSLGRRTSARSRVLLSALIVDLERDLVTPCAIVNLSEGGACLKLMGRPFLPGAFWLIALTSGLAYQARTIWRTEDRLGAEAIEPLDLAETESRVGRRLQKIWQGRR